MMRTPPVIFADASCTIRALTSLNLSENYINVEGAKHVADAIKVNVSALRFNWYHFELDLTSGSTAVVYGYCYYNTAKGALTSLNISANDLGQLVLPAGWSKEGLGRRAEYKHTDGRKQKEHPGKPEGVIAIANAIPTMGALATITFGDEQAVTMKTTMTEADFGGKQLGASGAIIVAAFLPKCQ